MITPEISEIIAAAIESDRIDIHTALPGRVQSYYGTTKTVDVEVGIRRALENEDDEIVYEDIGVLQNVRIWSFGGAANYVSVRLLPGDEGLLVFCEQNVGQWRATNDVAYPDEIGRHTLSGAFFLPGARRDANVITGDSDGVDLVTPYGTVTVSSTGIKLETAGGYIDLPVTGIVDVNGNLTVLP